VRLGSLLGAAPAVVSFWATYCPPCRAEVPALRAAARRWGSHGIRILTVALDYDEPGLVSRAAHEWGIDYDVVWVGEDQQDAVKALLPAGVPTTFLVGPHGVTRHDRFLDEAALDRLIAKDLAPEPSAGPSGP
jgi:cytochrome c biogenesis protein CcmG/thiol:disulfide interchange protein DsbE